MLRHLRQRADERQDQREVQEHQHNNKHGMYASKHKHRPPYHMFAFFVLFSFGRLQSPTFDRLFSFCHNSVASFSRSYWLNVDFDLSYKKVAFHLLGRSIQEDYSFDTGIQPRGVVKANASCSNSIESQRPKTVTRTGGVPALTPLSRL
jgi:hypothetical protein